MAALQLSSDIQSKHTQSVKKVSTKVSQSSQLTKQKISVGSSQVCQVCSTGVHPIWHCQQFRSMSPKQRNSKVLELKLCFKCLRDKHQAFQCQHKNPRLCRKCDRGHNYMLHDDSLSGEVPSPKSESVSTTSSS